MTKRKLESIQNFLRKKKIEFAENVQNEIDETSFGSFGTLHRRHCKYWRKQLEYGLLRDYTQSQRTLSFNYPVICYSNKLTRIFLLTNAL